MSGFLAAVSDDPAVHRSVESHGQRDLLLRGPDGLGFVQYGVFSCAWSLLCTRRGSAIRDGAALQHPRQFIAGDVRLDARAELLAKLGPAPGCDVNAADIELLGTAIRKYGLDIVEHLVGDFSFCLWDIEKQQLFVANDHMGVRPAYYCSSSKSFVAASNTFRALRSLVQTPTPNVNALIDFSLLGYRPVDSDTAWNEIKRLPPAHTLTVRREAAYKIRRYWDLAGCACADMGAGQDLVGQYLEILDHAVRDRMTEGSVDVALTGGVDSTSIAASLRASYPASPGSSIAISALTADMSAIDAHGHSEATYARIVGEHLNIKHDIRSVDRELDKDRTLSLIRNSDQPFYTSFLSATAWIREARSPGSRVLLWGHGGDEVFMPETALSEARTFGVLHALRSHLRCWRAGLPRLEFGLRASLERCSSIPDELVHALLLPDVAKQYKAARAEIDPVQDPRRRLLGNPGLRSTAVYKLSHPVWTELTAQWDCGRTNGLPVSCYPFLDRRMIEFALGLPVVPHCVGKSLARRAQLGRLPRAVVDRKKFVSLAGGGPAYGSSVCANVSTQFETNLFQSQALDCSLGNHLDSPALAGASQRARLACTWFDIWGTAPVF